uniref:Uncharacterized protein n=1 Tax=Caenorhabditis japonica TaxID=281687 RepID=A0A8R1IJE6_CAEJA
MPGSQAGEFHGASKTWDRIAKAEYGTFLLHRALATLRLEGIRLITEGKLPESIYPFVSNRRGAGGVRTPKTPK